METTEPTKPTNQEQVDQLQRRMELLEEKTQQVTDLLAGLAQVTQQLMEMNQTVLDAAKKLRSQKNQ